VGVVENAGSGVVAPREGQIVADLCVVGVTRNMQFGPRVLLYLFQMVSMRQRLFASRSPTLQPSR
jgi:hypothetical protein